jgi:hypothetical protein
MGRMLGAQLAAVMDGVEENVPQEFSHGPPVPARSQEILAETSSANALPRCLSAL